jgi:23S rRNA (adenine2503-C2)-methyltransferase
MEQKRNIYSVGLEEMRETLSDQPEYRAAQVLHWLYCQRVERFEQMSNLSEALRDQLAGRFLLGTLTCLRRNGSNDTTQKFLFQLQDGNLIESVLIPASPALYGSDSDRRTLCISTQVGCAYGCKFCASGLNGWTRNLEAGEIVEQILKVENLSGEKINNLVFMGMGEPLANFDQLMRAIAHINAPWGLSIGARHITVSTSGLAPKIKELADQPLQVRLAISLHGATDEIRQKIMPVNRRYNLEALLEACVYYKERKKQRITFEYILIENINDQLEQAQLLAGLALKLDAKINLIPYNTVGGLPWKRPSGRRQQTFYQALRRMRVDATIRREKGHDINAACGQLRLQTIKGKQEFPSGGQAISLVS